MARSPASGYRFIGAMEGAGVLPVLTGRTEIPSLPLDPVAQIEPVISSQTSRVKPVESDRSSQTSESDGRVRPSRVVRIA